MKKVKERRMLSEKERIIYIPLNKCVPMPEIHRQAYNPKDFQYLKNLIDVRGFNKCFAIRGIWTKGLFEVFDGTHRLQAVKELGTYGSIAARDESSFRTRSEAICEGIISNQARSAFNPIDLAESLRDFGKIIVQGSHCSTKPMTVGVYEIAERMQMSPAKVSLLLKLLKLPKNVQDYIREGKFKFTHAMPLMSLVGTEYEKYISTIADDAAKRGFSVKDIWAKVGAIKNKGTFNDNTICQVCFKPHPRFTMKHDVCPNCIVKNGNTTELSNPYKESYLKFNHFVETHYPNNGGTVPVFVRDKLNELHSLSKVIQ